MPGWSGYANGALLVTFAGGFLVVVGYVLPFWVSFDHHTCPDNKDVRLFAYVSVWYAMACEKGKSDSCQIEGIQLKTETNAILNFSSISGCTGAEFSTNIARELGQNTYWWAIQIMTSFGLGLTILAAIAFLYCKCADVASRRLFLVISLLLLTGGSLFLSVVIIVAVAMTGVFSIPDHDTIPETFPWSLLTSGIGSLLSLVGGILSLVIVCGWKKVGMMFDKREKDDGEATNVEMSETMAHPTGIHPWFTDGVQFYKGGDGQALSDNRRLESSAPQGRNMYQVGDDASRYNYMKSPNVYDREKRSSYGDSPLQSERNDTSQTFMYPGSRVAKEDLSRSSNKDRDISKSYFSNSKKYKAGEPESLHYSDPYDDSHSRRLDEDQEKRFDDVSSRQFDDVSSRRFDDEHDRLFGEEENRRIDGDRNRQFYDEQGRRFDGYAKGVQSERTKLVEGDRSRRFEEERNIRYEGQRNPQTDGFSFVPKDRITGDQRLDTDDGRYGDHRQYDDRRVPGRPVFY